MISVPISRVLTPQLVVHASSSLFFARQEFDAAGLGKILPEEMRRAGLDRLAILHHRLDAERLHRAGEALASLFSPVKTGSAS